MQPARHGRSKVSAALLSLDTTMSGPQSPDFRAKAIIVFPDTVQVGASPLQLLGAGPLQLLGARRASDQNRERGEEQCRK